MEDKHDDTFLARWLSGDLSEAEKIRFENADEYQDYVNIIEGTNNLEAPSFDKQGLFAKIKDTKARMPNLKRLKIQLNILKFKFIFQE